jgi:hypothetical protein
MVRIGSHGIRQVHERHQARRQQPAGLGCN